MTGKTKIPRREFLKRCGLCIASVGSGVIFTACTGVRLLPHEVDGKRIRVEVATLKNVNYGLVRSDLYPKAIYLRREMGERYFAVLLECTHQQCEVAPVGDMLICPCHGSRYLSSGKVVGGPAERDLPSLSVITDSRFIYIDGVL